MKHLTVASRCTARKVEKRNRENPGNDCVKSFQLMNEKKIDLWKKKVSENKTNKVCKSIN